jgi:hypothetical protein
VHVAIDRLSDESRKRVRKHSKKLFGNQDTLLVAVAVARSSTGTVNATEIGWQVRLQANRVRTQLIGFVDLGYMDDGPMRDRTRWFVRRGSSFWSMCERVYSELTG